MKVEPISESFSNLEVIDCYWYYIDFLLFTELKGVIDRMHTLISFISCSFIHVQYSSPAPLSD
jgi:hypothetical protein